MNRIICVAVAAAVLGALSPAQSTGQAETSQDSTSDDLTKMVPRGFGVEVKMIFSPDDELPNVNFPSVPEELRTVPTHQGDGWFGTPGAPWVVPFPSSDINDASISDAVGITVAPQFTVSRLTFRGGIYIPQAKFQTTRPIAGDFDTYHAVNQFGTTRRGVGTSLVYYSVYYDGVDNDPKPFGEIEFRLHRFLSVIGGYGGHHNSYKIALESGYDRFNSLEEYEKVELGSIERHGAPYAAIRVGIPLAFGRASCRRGGVKNAKRNLSRGPNDHSTGF